jgi:MFS family permease
MSALRHYIWVTLAYWAFTLTDGALRMLVLLHFHAFGYTAVELAFLFLFYEFFGVVTNLVGGWLAARLGMKVTLFAGLALQVGSLLGLSVLVPSWPKALSIAYVMGVQALSGIAKDLTKMSSKSAIKVLVPEHAETALFKWVALLTGSKNALKGAGFFLGGLLLSWLGFSGALWGMASVLGLVLIACVGALPADLGQAKRKAKFTAIFSKTPAVNSLSAARFFLFGARDIWFVVGVPVFLSGTLGWSFTQVGAFLAVWVIGYGGIQALSPALIQRFTKGHAPQRGAALTLALLLGVVSMIMAIGMRMEVGPTSLLLTGLGVFGVIFALNSAVHSYLILAYSDGDAVALDVGFYYMANAGGRLAGTLLSGVLYEWGGLVTCLWGTVAFALLAASISLFLPVKHVRLPRGALVDVSD